MSDLTTLTETPADGRRDFLRRWLLPRPAMAPRNPVLQEQARERAKDGQNRLADAITTFAGSMTFVYIHVLWFASWIVLGVEGYPLGFSR